MKRMKRQIKHALLVAAWDCLVVSVMSKLLSIAVYTGYALYVGHIRMLCKL